MNHLISNMKNIPGVVGVAIFKDDGNLVAYDFPEAYDRSLLGVMGEKFQPIKEILPQEAGEIVYLCWEFEDLLGFYYPVEGGWVNILSGDQIPMPVFSLTMTAVSNKLPAMLEKAQSADAPGEAQAAPQSAVTGEIVGKDKMDEMEKIFSNYLGPASPVIFKRVAHHLGFTLNNFPVDQVKALLDGVIEKIPENKRDEVAQQAGKFY
jgi:hypothetical protein